MMWTSTRTNVRTNFLIQPSHRSTPRRQARNPALQAFNDVIVRQAALKKIPLIDLRLLCNDAADYANPIEPSEIGGSKIARTIVEITKEHDFSNQNGSVIYF